MPDITFLKSNVCDKFFSMIQDKSHNIFITFLHEDILKWGKYKALSLSISKELTGHSFKLCSPIGYIKFLKQTVVNKITTRKGSIDDSDVQQQEIIHITNSEFNEKQQEEIELGKKHGLTDKEIDIYRNHHFNEFEMREIRLGLEDKVIDNGYVELYAKLKDNKPVYDWCAMKEIRLGLGNKYLTFSDVATYMYAKGSTDESDLTSKQMQEIRKGLDGTYGNRINIEQAKFLHNFRYAPRQMHQLILAFIHEPPIAENGIKLLLKYLSLPNDEIEEIRLGLENGLSPEQVELYINYTAANYRTSSDIKK